MILFSQVANDFLEKVNGALEGRALAPAHRFNRSRGTGPGALYERRQHWGGLSVAVVRSGGIVVYDEVSRRAHFVLQGDAVAWFAEDAMSWASTQAYDVDYLSIRALRLTASEAFQAGLFPGYDLGDTGPHALRK